MSANTIGPEADVECLSAAKKMNSSELSDYRLRVMARTRGCNIHKVNNALQAVVLTNEFEMFEERNTKMKTISTLLCAQ